MSDEVKHTPGPWAWFGTGNNHNIYLATTHSGRRYVMGFERWGMNGAQPIFQPKRAGGMIPAKDLLKFEVGDRSVTGIDAAKKDGSVYRYDIRGIDCADACLIAASPELLENLKRVTDHLETWARDHSLESTCETMAALHCAHAAIKKAEGLS